MTTESSEAHEIETLGLAPEAESSPRVPQTVGDDFSDLTKADDDSA